MSPLLSYFIYLFTFVYLKVTNCPFLSLYLSVCICLTLSLSVLMSLSLGLFMSLSIWAIVSFFSCQSSFSYLSISFYCLFLYVAIASLFDVNLDWVFSMSLLLLLYLYLLSILIWSSVFLYLCSYCIFLYLPISIGVKKESFSFLFPNASSTSGHLLNWLALLFKSHHFCFFFVPLCHQVHSSDTFFFIV